MLRVQEFKRPDEPVFTLEVLQDTLTEKWSVKETPARYGLWICGPGTHLREGGEFE
jgi:hypothetical protein